MQNFELLAQEELDRADRWANRDNVIDADLRTRMVEHSLHRATIYALLSISEQINLLGSDHEKESS